MPNQPLADAFIAAVYDTSGRFVSTPGYCEEFVRQVIQSVYGSIYDDLYAASAWDTADNWISAGKAMPANTTPYENGDLFFKQASDQPNGHASCYVGPVPGVGTDMVASNSVTQIGRINGARGFRTLAQWGKLDVLVRIEPPQRLWTVTVNGVAIATDATQDASGSVLVQVRSWAQFFGFVVTVNADNSIKLNGKSVVNPSLAPAYPALIGGHDYLPVRILADNAGLQVAVNGNTVVVTR